MAGEGEILRKAREDKGLSYSEVEEITKIRSWYLEALEKENYDILPGRAYTKGFLRTYSRFLGLNSDEIITLYNSSLEAEDFTEFKPPLTPIQSTPVWFRPNVLVIMAVIAIVIVGGLVYFTKQNGSTQNSDYEPPLLPTAPEIEQSNEQSQEERVTPEQAETEIYEGLVAELSFHENCWLRVKVDGVLVQDGTLKAGTIKVFEGTEQIEFVSVGNAGGFEIKLNGELLPPLGKSGEVINNYVLTKDTLNNME
ncbi:MAG: helix-turn-helix domain-containing protein [Peptococcaceae bacterium]|nr:helix-turn-helix domain-containing protein [Peptococcaceae bacterium]